jgi:hypothetical protein
MLLDLGSSSAVALDHDSSGVDSVDDLSRDNGDKHCIVVPTRGWATKSGIETLEEFIVGTIEFSNIPAVP